MAVTVVNPDHRPPPPSTVEEPTVFGVEGMDQAYFFGALLRYLGLDGVVWNLKGKSEYKKRLTALKQTTGFEQNVVSLGVVRDADDNAAAAFESVQGALRAAQLPVPEHPLEPIGDAPQVTVMVLPGQGEPGMLENLCLKAVEGDPAMVCVNRYFECLKQENVPLPRNRAKANLQVFLASRKKVALRVGEAAQAKVWPWEGQAFGEVKRFLQLVCSRPEG